MDYYSGVLAIYGLTLPELILLVRWDMEANHQGDTLRLGRARPRHRPDVTGYFTVTLVSAIASGFLLGADLLRAQVGLRQFLAFAAVDPMAYILACCVGLLAALLAVGDV
jgi:hypothetical protein